MLTRRDVWVNQLIWWSHPLFNCPCIVVRVTEDSFVLRSPDGKETRVYVTYSDKLPSLEDMSVCTADQLKGYLKGEVQELVISATRLRDRINMLKTA